MLTTILLQQIYRRTKRRIRTVEIAPTVATQTEATTLLQQIIRRKKRKKKKKKKRNENGDEGEEVTSALSISAREHPIPYHTNIS